MTAWDYYFATPELFDTSHLKEDRETIEGIIRDADTPLTLVELSCAVRKKDIDILVLDTVMRGLQDEGRVEITADFVVIAHSL